MQFTFPLRTLTARASCRPTIAAILSSTRSQSASYDFPCLGWDGRPLRGSVGECETGRQWLEEEENLETEDYRKYYENHKPSPLSKMEFVDTRKPIIRATDRAGDENEFMLLRETVDDALRRAEEMYWEAKVRGDPDSPQARALARMLRERYNNGEDYKANAA